MPGRSIIERLQEHHLAEARTLPVKVTMAPDGFLLSIGDDVVGCGLLSKGQWVAIGSKGTTLARFPVADREKALEVLLQDAGLKRSDVRFPKQWAEAVKGDTKAGKAQQAHDELMLDEALWTHSQPGVKVDQVGSVRGIWDLFLVSRDGSPIGFVQVPKFSRTTERPVQAFKLATDRPGENPQVGDLLGSFYQEDGGKKAALLAVVKAAGSQDRAKQAHDELMLDEASDWEKPPGVTLKKVQSSVNGDQFLVSLNGEGIGFVRKRGRSVHDLAYAAGLMDDPDFYREGDLIGTYSDVQGGHNAALRAVVASHQHRGSKATRDQRVHDELMLDEAALKGWEETPVDPADIPAGVTLHRVPGKTFKQPLYAVVKDGSLLGYLCQGRVRGQFVTPAGAYLPGPGSSLTKPVLGKLVGHYGLEGEPGLTKPGLNKAALKDLVVASRVFQAHDELLLDEGGSQMRTDRAGLAAVLESLGSRRVEESAALPIDDPDIEVTMPHVFGEFLVDRKRKPVGAIIMDDRGGWRVFVGNEWVKDFTKPGKVSFKQALEFLLEKA